MQSTLFFTIGYRTVITSWFAVLLFFATGCQLRHEKAEAQKLEAVSPIPAEEFMTPPSAFSAQDTGADSARSQYAYPNDSIDLYVDLLEATQYHGDEVDKRMLAGGWYGLFKGKNGYYLDQAALQSKRVHDAVVDETDGAATGWEITVDHSDTTVLLVSDKARLQPGPVRSSIGASLEISPGQQHVFVFGSHTFRLFATGRKVVGSGPDDYWFEEYRLYLERVTANIRTTQLLVATPAFDDAMTEILFVGDLDGDALPDLIMDTASHYNVRSPTLYLSKPAPNGKLVRVVGLHTSVGC